jgi:lipoprotein-anchoring transpeptidase ErfK/SrfK
LGNVVLINPGDHLDAAIRPGPGIVRAAAPTRRLGLAAGVAVAVLMTGSPAEAQFFDSIFGSPYRYRPAPYQPAQPNLYRPRPKRVDTAKKDPAVKPPPGPLLIAISLNSQRLTLYANGAPIAHSPVSTGTPSNPTPTGIFSVIQKNRHHRSNLYSNAPMPFMQRITWSGVALHQGVLPGYPASHGCIRLPASFAAYLWGTTRIGTGARVIITRDEVAPAAIAHAKLFVHKPKTEEDVVAQAAELAPRVKIAETEGKTASDASTSTQAVMSPAEREGALALKGSLDAVQPAVAATPAAAPVAKPPTPVIGRAKSVAAGEASDLVDPQTPSRTAADTSSVGTAAGDAIKSGRPAAEARETPRMSEAVSVFISRKAGRLYVRQGYEPLFDVPVTIQDPDAPIGTHLYTATDFAEDRTTMRWNAITLPSRSASEPERVRGETKAERNAREEQAARVARYTRSSPSAALDRIEIPQDTVDRIAELMSPGASLIISDYPISGETGKYTDFIVLTR